MKKCAACLKALVLKSPTTEPLVVSDERLPVNASVIINGDSLCYQHAVAALVRDDEAVRVRLTGSSS